MIKNELGEFLRKIRTEVYEEGVKKFARRLDIPAWTYRSIEEGRTIHPKKETLLKLEKGLQIKLTDMDFRELSMGLQHSYRKIRYVSSLNTIKERIFEDIEKFQRIPTNGKYEIDVEAHNEAIKEVIQKLEEMIIEENKEKEINWLEEMENDFYSNHEEV